MPKIVDHEQYRKELLGRCFHQFAEKGYASITMRQLAQGIGVSTGTLYHYFPSKQIIFEQMMLERVERSIREFDAGLSDLSDIRGKIAAIFQYFEKEEAEAIKELVLYVEFHQYQQRQGQTNNIISQVYQRLKPEAEAMLGSRNQHLVQFVFSIIDGLLLAHVYGQTVDWTAQAELVGTLLETYKLGEPSEP